MNVKSFKHVRVGKIDGEKRVAMLAFVDHCHNVGFYSSKITYWHSSRHSTYQSSRIISMGCSISKAFLGFKST